MFFISFKFLTVFLHLVCTLERHSRFLFLISEQSKSPNSWKAVWNGSVQTTKFLKCCLESRKQRKGTKHRKRIWMRCEGFANILWWRFFAKRPCTTRLIHEQSIYDLVNEKSRDKAINWNIFKTPMSIFTRHWSSKFKGLVWYSLSGKRFLDKLHK